MKLKKYIHFDKTINKFIINLISFFLIKKKKKLYIEKKKVKNIIVVKFLGIGSISRSLGMISHLKIIFPNSKISFVTFEENESFMKIIKPIDRYYLINKKNLFLLTMDFLKLIFILRKKNSILIDLEVHSYFAKIFCFLIKAKLKLGFFIKEKYSIYDEIFKFKDDIFIEKNYYNISNFFDENFDKKSDIFSLLNLSKNLLTIEKTLNQIDIRKNEKFFVININASDLCDERKWQLDNFIILIKKILDLNYKILLIGSSSERKTISDLEKKIFSYNKNNLFNLAGKTDIGELFCILKYYNCVFITCDTGPLHLANIAKCATISLWGPGTPKSYAENYENHIIMYKNVYCSPCIYIHIDAPCNGNNICMKNISVDEVFDESLKLIKKI